MDFGAGSEFTESDHRYGLRETGSGNGSSPSNPPNHNTGPRRMDGRCLFLSGRVCAVRDQRFDTFGFI